MLVQIRRLEQQRRPRGRVARGRQAVLEQREPPGPVARLLEGLEEQRRRLRPGTDELRIGEQLAQASPRAGVRGVLREHRAVAGERPRRLARSRAVEIAELLQQALPPGPVERQLEPVLEDRRQLLPSAGRAEQRGERVDGLLALPEVLLDLAPGGDGRVRRPELLRVDVRRAHPVLARRVASAGRVRGAHQRRDERLPPLLALEHGDGRLVRLAVGGVVAEHQLPRAQRPIRVAERVCQRGGLAPEPPLAGGAGLEHGAPLQHLEPLGAALVPRQQRVEPPADLEHRHVIDFRRAEDARVEPRRAGVVPDLVRAHPRRLEEQRHRARLEARDGRRRVRRARQRVGVAIEPPGTVPELAQASARGLGLGIEREQLGVVLQRLGLAPLAHQELGDLAVQGGPVRGLRRAQRHAEDADDLAGLSALGVEAAQLTQGSRAHRRDRAREGEDPLQDVHGCRHPAGPVLQEVEGLVEGLPRALQAVEQAGRDLRPPRLRRRAFELAQVGAPQIGELAEAPLALEQALQGVRDLPVARRELREGLQVLDGAVRAAREILGDLRRLAVQLGAPRRLGGAGDDAIVEREQLGPAALDGVRHRQPAEGPIGRGIDGDRAREHGVDGRAVLEPLAEEGDRALAQLERELAWELGVDGGAVRERHLFRALVVGGEPLGVVP